MDIKTRFAPSPTGNPHVGNIRTALFDYLFAKSQGGKFILRIEDTDKKREVKESNQAILDSLKWLGLNWDEGPILQSERLDIYKQYTHDLVKKGFAYEKDGAIYFETKKEGKTSWTDLVGNKRIEFDNKTQEDFVLLKSDGFPTYHLANVVDDRLMGITHVTRGEDWISSTPKHIMLYDAFGWPIPQFGHFPNILATDKSKLSKRHGAVGILDFKKDGILPEALVNYLTLLGWTPPGGQEILTLDEMVKVFKIEDVNGSAAVFDIQKLEWMNGEYIRKMSDEELTKRLQEYLVDHPAKEKIATVVPLIKERIKKLSDFVPLTDFWWEKPEYDMEVFGKLKTKNLKQCIGQIVEKLEVMKTPWNAESFEKTFRDLAKELEISATDMFQLIRVAVSGQLVTPPLFESIQILGEEETSSRVKQALKFIG